MSETGETGMLSPEQKEQKIAPSIFQEELLSLVEPQRVINDQGEEETLPPQVNDVFYVRLIKRAVKNPSVDLKQLLNSVEKQAADVSSNGTDEEYDKIESEFLAICSIIGQEINRRGEEQVVSSESPSASLSEALNRSAKAMETSAIVQMESATGSSRLSLPENKEERRSYVRAILDRIENSNREAHDYSISGIFNALESSINDIAMGDEQLARETIARLSLHDASELIKRGDGWIKNAIGGSETIGRMATTADERNHEISREVVKTLLEEGLPGLDVAYAWDQIEEANYGYIDLVKSVNETLSKEDRFDVSNLEENIDDQKDTGKVPTNFFADSNGKRKSAIREFLVKKIARKIRVDNYYHQKGKSIPNTESEKDLLPEEIAAARKSFQLAEKLTIATLETSVFNRTSMTGNDQLSEIIGLKGWRSGRAKSGRDRGPQVHEKLIDGFGTSFLRTCIKKGSEKDNNQPFYVGDIDFDKIGEGNWVYHCSVIIAKWNSLRDLLMNRETKPGEINVNFLQKAVDYFNKADKPPRLRDKEGEDLPVDKQPKMGKKNLRFFWLLGVVDLALGDTSLGWDVKSIAELGRMVTKEKLSDEAGSFLDEGDWDYIKRFLSYSKRIKGKSLERVMRSISGGSR